MLPYPETAYTSASVIIYAVESDITFDLLFFKLTVLSESIYSILLIVYGSV